MVDVTGMRVYPGLVAVGSFGLFGGGGNLTDSVEPYNKSMTLALAAGVTTAVNGSSVAKLKRGHIEGLMVKSQAWNSWSFSNGNPTGQLKVRENLKKAAAYLRAYRQWEIDKRSNKDLKEPSKKGVDQKSVEILTGKSRPKFSANDRTDLLEIARLAQEFGFRPIIEGCTEGWTIAAELGRAGATAIVTPRSRESERSSSTGLARKGVGSLLNLRRPRSRPTSLRSSRATGLRSARATSQTSEVQRSSTLSSISSTAPRWRRSLTHTS